MPSWFRLRRARRYDVSSRNSYVVCVHLLDNTLIECTMTADSLGQECLENVSQRIELNEMEYFGLRYVNKKLQFRWVDLEKPLKKQLDKNAHSPLLYFGVMYYVANAHNIRDEMTRYQYYLQLKTDVIEGKLPCTPSQATTLASYSVQGEFGDHDSERHTADYLKDFVLLPRNMTTDDRTLADLTQDVIDGHQRLKGVPAAIAELQYIIEVQQLEGYGLEYYPAKDESGSELLIGSSFVGIFVKHLNGQPTVYFKWADINRLTYNKRTFGIDTSLSGKTVQFVMDNPDVAKYIYKMCSNQHLFYRHSAKALNDDKDGVPVVGVCSIGPIPDIQQTAQGAMNLQQTSGLRDSYRQDSFRNQTNANQAPDVSSSHVEDINSNQQVLNPTDSTDLSESQISNGTTILPVVATEVPAPSVVSQQNQIMPAVKLPEYRPTPDYESVMRQRMERMVQSPNHFEQLNNVTNLSQAQVYAHPEAMAYSQPEIGYAHHYLNQHHVYSNGYIDVANPHLSYHRPIDRSESLIIQPTYSTPELNSQGLSFSTSENMISEALLNQYRPPPPYPRSYPRTRASSSTPDLATQTMRVNANSSPDLVSRKNLSNAQLVQQSHLDQSVDNLTFEAHSLHLSQQHLRDSSMGPLDLPQTPIRVIGGYSDRQPKKVSYMRVRTASDAAITPSYTGHSDTSTHCTCGGPLDCLMHEAHPPMAHIYANTPIDKTFLDLTQIDCTLQTMQPPSPLTGMQFLRPSGSLQHSQLTGAAHSPLPPPPEYGATHHRTISDATDSVIPSDHESSVAHSASSSMDASSLSYAEASASSLSASVTPEPQTPQDDRRVPMGPMKIAAMNGLSMSRGSVLEPALLDDSRAPKDERRRMLENKLEEGQVFVEFEQIPRKAPTDASEVAAKPENKERNRFKDVYPYDKNRVRLNASKKNPSGYINASHIKVSVKGELWWYIATQGPLPDTTGDFWQMVWEQNVDVIAMLTGIQENGKQKCQMYWPEQQGHKNKIKFGEYQVELQFSNESQGYVTRGMQLRHTPSKKQRLIWHLQYTDWPDHGCPEDIWGFLAFLDEIESVKRHVIMERKDEKHQTPVVVHCSAGVGRSGVVILSEIMKACLEHNVNADVPSMLCQLRCQRMHMVQTVSQYSFVYKTLVQYLKNSRLI